MRLIIPIILLTCLSVPGLATSYNFTGGTGNWNSSANWTPAGIPGAGDDVTIDAGDAVTIPAVYSAAARSVAMTASGDLTVASTGSLAINGSGSAVFDGINLSGSGTTLTNAGTISIGNSSAIGGRGIYVLFSAFFDNLSGSVLNIDNIALQGLEIGLASATNAGTIKIGNTTALAFNGISLNQATLTNSSTGTIECNRTAASGISSISSTSMLNNSGIIRIGNVAAVGGEGIAWIGTLTNNSSGVIGINSVTNSNGILLSTSGTTVTNAGTINIGNSAAVKLRGVYVQSGTSFTNQSGGAVNIDNITTNNGIETSSGSVSNAGSIKIGNTTAIKQNGISMNGGSLSNASTGSIECNRTTDNNGILISGTSTTMITNSGSIKIGNVAAIKDNGINMSAGTLTNNAGGTIEINRVTFSNGILLVNSGTSMTNAGSITIGNIAAINARGIWLQSGTSLTNQSGGFVNIDNISLNNGIETTSGSMSNAGTIKIGNTTAVNQNGFLINGGSLTNAATGAIECNRIATGTGIISLTATSAVTNSGSIKIGNLAALNDNGISIPAGTLTNNIGAIIEIDRITTNFGILSQSTVINSGSIKIGANAAVNSVGIFNLSGAFTNNAGATIEIDRIATFDGILVRGTFTNSGSIKIGANAALSRSGIYNASGTFTNNSGAIVEIDNVPNTPAGTDGITAFGSTSSNAGTIKLGTTSGLKNGIGNDGGTGTFTNTGTLTFGPNITLNGINAGMTVTNSTGGTVQTIASGLLKIAGTLTSSATITNNATGIVTVNGTLTNSGTMTNNGTGTGALIVNGTLTNSGTTTNNGTIKGTGTITQSGTFTNASGSHIAPGLSPGTLTVSGNFDLGSAILDIEVNGATTTLYDRLNVSGIANLTNASLNVTLNPSYAPTISDVITFINAGTVIGTFASEQAAGLSVRYNFPAAGQVSLGTGIALPVKLTAFNARLVTGNDALLSWSVANPKEGRTYVIERSSDAANFTAIGTVSATTSTEYSLHDHAPLAGKSYYRLRIAETDGSGSYSDVVSIFIGGGSYVNVSPSPAHDYFVIVTDADGLMATLTDMQGKVQLRFAVNNGGKVDVTALPAGIYLLKMSSGQLMKIVKE